jgi:hypothetical protein
VLILITSAGIYGYLSSAYQKTADQTSIIDSKIASLETKKKLYENTRSGILQEKQSLSELKGSLSKGTTTQFTDRKGNLVVRSNNASIKQIENASKSDEKLSTKLDIVNDSIFALETKMLEIKTTAVGESELGPLKYLSQLTGVTMDRIINWYILVIIFVFDPLAIALVVAANFAFAQLIKRKETPIEEKVEDMRKVVDAYDGLQEEIENHKPSPGVPVMVDPKTGKFFYEEPEVKVVMSGEPSLKNLDLDGDGVVEEEELQQIFDEADTNNDGVIDENEAKAANLSVEDTNKLNQFNESLERLKSITDNINTTEHFKKMMVVDEVANLRKLLTQQFQPKKDDDTITYF